MSKQSGRFFRLWQELRRREVFGVVTTYAATAYIIIEVTNNLAVPLHLPEWFSTLELIILVIGLPVVVVLSWIFDITPTGIKKTEKAEETGSKEMVSMPSGKRLRPSHYLNAVLIVLVIILAYPRIFRHDTIENLRSKGDLSVVVLPFRNMTNDTIWDVWQEGIQDNLITALSDAGELKVRQAESVTGSLEKNNMLNYASLTPDIARTISRQLGANVMISGSINESGPTIRLNAKIINPRTEETFKSFQLDGNSGNILPLVDSLASLAGKFLIITGLENKSSPDDKHYVLTNSPEAYKFFTYGQKAYRRRDYPSAINMYSQALKIDSGFVAATMFMSFSNALLFKIAEAKALCLKAYNRRDQLPLLQRILTEYAYALYFQTPNEVIKSMKQLLEIDEQYPAALHSLGLGYSRLYQYDKAIPEIEKGIRIAEEWGPEFISVTWYTDLGKAYHETGRLRKEKKLYKIAEKYYPDDYGIAYNQAVLALSLNDTASASFYIDKYVSIRRELSKDDATIMNDLGSLYTDAKKLDKAEESYRKALYLEPGSPLRLNNLAYFLINNDRNVAEGLELVEKALEAFPDNYFYQDTKGWGLYKQGKYREALELISNAWNKKYAYDHGLYLHVEAAKNAVAGLQK